MTLVEHRVGLAVTLAVVGVTAWPSPRAEAVSPCDVLTGAARVACDAAGGLNGGVGGAMDGVVGSVATTALDGLASAFAEAAGTFLDKLAGLLGATTRVDISAPWFVGRYAVMFGLSALLTLVLLLLAVVKAVVRGQGVEAIRSATLNYLAAVVVSAFAPAAVYLLVQLSDAVTAVLLSGADDRTVDFLHGTGTALTGLGALSPGGTSATVLIAALLTIVCAVVLWVELLLRTAIIYVATLFAAPTFSGLVDRALWKHSRRWVAFVVSVVFAKPVVVAVMTLAAAGAGDPGGSDGLSSVFVALALMIVAVFCVGLLFRFIPSAGDDIAGALTARRELRAATPNSPLPAPSVLLRQGVLTHLSRSRGAATAAGTTTAGAGVAAAGVATHRVATAGARGATSAAAAAGAASRPDGRGAAR